MIDKQPTRLLTLLRFALAWIFIYSSVSKILQGNWSAEGFLSHATTFPDLFAFFAQPENIAIVNLLNVYGQLLLGLSLLFGVFLPLAAISGSFLMLLYYLPVLHFPYAGEGTTSFLIDQHILIILILFLLWKTDAGKYVGLKNRLEKMLPKSLKKYN